MMGLLKDLTGQRFGMLTVLRRGEDRINPNGSHRVQWVCRCDCGAVVEVPGDGLRKGETKSCGCKPKNYTVINGYAKPLPKQLTINTRLVIGNTYTIKGRRYKLVGLYGNYARFETFNGFHDCWSYWELERMLPHG